LKKINVIVGCGYYGRAIYRKIRIKKKKIVFVDNNFNIKKCFNKKVLKPHELIKIQKDINLIYFAGRYLDEQIPQIKKLNLKKKMIIFKNKELLPKKKIIIARENKILKILDLILTNFNKEKINYWIDRSSLLAIFRKQYFSEFSDVDISVDIKDYNRFSKLLKKLFKKNNNLKEKTIFFKNKKYSKFYISSKSKNTLKEEPVFIDFIYRRFEKKMVKSIGIKLIDIPLRFFNHLQMINYKEISFKIPKYSKKYLNLIYGIKWKKPINFYLKSKRI